MANYRITPYRLGYAVGESGANFPCPYAKGSLGEDCFRQGVKFGTAKRKEMMKGNRNG